MSYIETISVGNQGQFTHTFITIFITSVFLIFMDLVDEIMMESSLEDRDNSYERTRNIARIVKIIGAIYCILSLGLAIW
jgi:hypothetical protein